MHFERLIDVRLALLEEEQHADLVQDGQPGQIRQPLPLRQRIERDARVDLVARRNEPRVSRDSPPDEARACAAPKASSSNTR